MRWYVICLKSCPPEKTSTNCIPQSATQSTAAQRVLSIAELLEQILLELDHVAPFGLQRVNTRFRDIIVGSSVLQERMLRPKFSSIENASEDATNYYGVLELRPKIRRAMAPFGYTQLHNTSPTLTFIKVVMDEEWYQETITRNVWMVRGKARCEALDQSWNKIMLRVEGTKVDPGLSIEKRGAFLLPDPIEQCTLREFVEMCWKCLEEKILEIMPPSKREEGEDDQETN